MRARTHTHTYEYNLGVNFSRPTAHGATKQQKPNTPKSWVSSVSINSASRSSTPLQYIFSIFNISNTFRTRRVTKMKASILKSIVRNVSIYIYIFLYTYIFFCLSNVNFSFHALRFIRRKKKRKKIYFDHKSHIFTFKHLFSTQLPIFFIYLYLYIIDSHPRTLLDEAYGLR